MLNLSTRFTAPRGLFRSSELSNIRLGDIAEEGHKMKPLHVKIFLSAMLSCLLYSAGTAAQSAYPKALTLTQIERLAVDLKQGMTLEEVEQLLGKPKRTALKAQGYGGLHESQSSLQWTYTWSSPSQSDRSLQVLFAGNTPERWLVNSWEWIGY